jgi:hypothetical protein
MKENAEKLMQSIWDARNAGADTEEKLTAEILTLALDTIPQYNTQNSMVVVNKEDLLSLATELRNLK